ncbi:MAG: hypothetical protein HZB43_08690 [candidate division Zixibacteria bacterium]|nr:hypothetical protein [candidate division Zixibacteria bacterium]
MTKPTRRAFHFCPRCSHWARDILLILGAATCLSLPSAADAQTTSSVEPDSRELAGKIPCRIVGGCDYDSVTQQTICKYTVYSGNPALSNLTFPIPNRCASLITVSSPLFKFSGPETYNSKWCGPIYGLKTEQGMKERQVTTFTIVYDGISPLGIGIVSANLKGGTNCEKFPVQGVVDCQDLPCVQWSLDATEFDFRIRKPEVLAGRLATMTVQGNTSSKITFSLFDNLAPLDGSGSPAIPASYAITPSDQPAPPVQFLSPALFNLQLLSVPGDETPHRFSIWSKIAPDRTIKACDYRNAAIITLTLENLSVMLDTIGISTGGQ